VRRAWRRKGLMALASALMLLQWVAGLSSWGSLLLDRLQR